VTLQPDGHPATLTFPDRRFGVSAQPFIAVAERTVRRSLLT